MVMDMTGATGTMGTMGATGTMGTMGATGMTGTMGAMMVPGATGVTTGATSVRGSIGARRVKGATGVTATTGAMIGLDARDERWYQAELLRIKGELLLHESEHRSGAVAEQYFGKAAELARSQGALFWELRSTMCLTRVRMDQDRRAEARGALTQVYDKFTEGFETADLRAARALLAELAS